MILLRCGRLWIYVVDLVEIALVGADDFKAEAPVKRLGGSVSGVHARLDGLDFLLLADGNDPRVEHPAPTLLETNKQTNKFQYFFLPLENKRSQHTRR